jgi:hypothetical protein
VGEGAQQRARARAGARRLYALKKEKTTRQTKKKHT